MLGILLLPIAIVLWVLELMFSIVVFIIAILIEVIFIIVNLILWPFVWFFGFTARENEEWNEDENNIT
jgi:hypothetical protein